VLKRVCTFEEEITCFWIINSNNTIIGIANYECSEDMYEAIIIIFYMLFFFLEANSPFFRNYRKTRFGSPPQY
jgi:hypothetical protein